MPAIRLSFLIALLVTAIHAVAAAGSATDWTVAARNLLWWQIATALTGAIVAFVAQGPGDR